MTITLPKLTADQASALIDLLEACVLQLWETYGEELAWIEEWRLNEPPLDDDDLGL
jgi:hypothetical protein